MFDMLGSLKTVAEDRIKSPVFGTAAFLLGIHEWQVLATIVMSYKYSSPNDLIIGIQDAYVDIDWRFFWGQYFAILFAFPVLGFLVDLAKSVLDVGYKNLHNKIQGYELLRLDATREFRSQMLEEKNRTRDLLEGIIAEKKELEEKATESKRLEQEWRAKLTEQEQILRDKTESFAIEKNAARKELDASEKKAESSSIAIASRVQERNECFLTIQRVQGVIAEKIEGKKLSAPAIKSICNTLGVFYLEAEKYGREFVIDGQTMYALEKIYKHLEAPSFATDPSSIDQVQNLANQISTEMRESKNGLVEPFLSALDRAKIGIVRQSIFENPLCLRFCIQKGLIEIITESRSEKLSDERYLTTTLGKECYKILKYSKNKGGDDLLASTPSSRGIAIDPTLVDDELPF